MIAASLVLAGCGGSGSPAPEPTTEQLACSNPEPGLHLVKDYWNEEVGGTGYEVYGGYALSACDLILVGISYPIQPPVGIIQGTPPPPIAVPDQPPGVVMRSSDGGESAEVTTTITDDWFLKDVEFSDPSTAWLAGSTVYKSFDGGKTWGAWPRAPDGTGPGGIALSNGKVFMAGGVGCEGRLYSAFFEPPEWELVSGFRYGGGCAELKSIDSVEDTIVATGSGGNGGLIVVSQDGGESFESISFPYEELTLGDHATVADKNHAWVNGIAHIGPESSRTSESRLLATSDGGVTWRRVEIPNMAWSSTVLFTSPERGFVSGAVNGSKPGEFATGIFVTSDGGETWEFYPYPDNDSAGQGLIAASDGTLYTFGNGNLYRGWFGP